MKPLSKEDQAFLDENMMAYLGRKSCTSYYSVQNHFELHSAAEVDASLARLEAVGRIRYDGRRNGYSTCAPTHRVGEDSSG
jgi:hypothetical protein